MFIYWYKQAMTWFSIIPCDPCRPWQRRKPRAASVWMTRRWQCGLQSLGRFLDPQHIQFHYDSEWTDNFIYWLDTFVCVHILYSSNTTCSWQFDLVHLGWLSPQIAEGCQCQQKWSLILSDVWWYCRWVLVDLEWWCDLHCLGGLFQNDLS